MKKLLLAAALLNLIAALIHTIAGHFKLILPFAHTDIANTLKAILHACWHMVTVILFFSSLALFYIGLRPQQSAAIPIANLIGILYIAFSLAFILVGIGYQLFLPQVVLLLPIGIMSIIGARHIGRDAAYILKA